MDSLKCCILLNYSSYTKFPSQNLTHALERVKTSTDRTANFPTSFRPLSPGNEGNPKHACQGKDPLTQERTDFPLAPVNQSRPPRPPTAGRGCGSGFVPLRRTAAQERGIAGPPPGPPPCTRLSAKQPVRLRGIAFLSFIPLLPW